MTRDLKLKSMTKKNIRRPNSNNDKIFHEYIIKANSARHESKNVLVRGTGAILMCRTMV